MVLQCRMLDDETAPTRKKQKERGQNRKVVEGGRRLIICPVTDEDGAQIGCQIPRVPQVNLKITKHQYKRKRNVKQRNYRDGASRCQSESENGPTTDTAATMEHSTLLFQKKSRWGWCRWLLSPFCLSRLLFSVRFCFLAPFCALRLFLFPFLI